MPEYDSRALWEKLVLDGFQAGLAWITILRKREAFRAAFADFDPEIVARFGDADRARLMADAGIVRSNAKIDAAIAGARIYLDMRERGEDFSDFLWAFVGGKPIQNRWTEHRPRCRPRRPLAAEMAKALKAKGFKFCGPVIVYAFMQAVGMVNDHVAGCFRHAGAWPALSAQPREPWRRPAHACWRRPARRRSAASTRPGAGPGPGRSAPAAVILEPRARPQGRRRLQEAHRQARASAGGRDQGRRASPGASASPRVEEIAALNILHATGLAMRRAVEAMAHRAGLRPGRRQLRLRPALPGEDGGRRRRHLRLDRRRLDPGQDRPRPADGGDGRAYPGYGFAAHKGYRAPVHAEALLRLGPCAIHRMAWAPVRLALAGEDPMVAAELG